MLSLRVVEYLGVVGLEPWMIAATFKAEAETLAVFV